ncbi:MAG: hypothetical protein JWR09_922 [Mucilaginibacter sp.]|nr:hypothetical protein [Mucilaginibacter sp.]
MNKFLVVIALLIPCLSFAQPFHIDSAKWISNDLGYLSFYQDEVKFNFDGNEDFKRFRLSHDTLMMVDTYTTSADKFALTHIDLFKFFIQHAGDSSLTIKPVNDKAKKLVRKSSYQFKNLKYCIDSTIKFKRLTFTAGWCMGTCPIMKIDIDNTGKFYLEGNNNTEPFTGSFKGQLSNIQLDTLNYFLQHSELKKMFSWKQGNVVMDAPNYRLTISYNNQKLLIETNEPPLNVSDLINFLLRSYKNVTLVHDNVKHSFD